MRDAVEVPGVTRPTGETVSAVVARHGDAGGASAADREAIRAELLDEIVTFAEQWAEFYRTTAPASKPWDAINLVAHLARQKFGKPNWPGEVSLPVGARVAVDLSAGVEQEGEIVRVVPAADGGTWEYDVRVRGGDIIAAQPAHVRLIEERNDA